LQETFYYIFCYAGSLSLIFMKEPERDIIVIGSSSGGFATLPKLTSQFPKDFPAAVFIVQHLAAGASGVPLIENLQKESNLICKIASHGESIKYSHVYVAPPDHHMLLKHGQVMVIRGPRENRFRPSIDMLFRSAAAEYSSKVIGIVLTGMLDDGTSGLEAIKKSGGLAVVQEPNDAICPEMPKSAIRNIKTDHVVPVSEMGNLLKELIYQPVKEHQPIPKHVVIEAEIAQRYILGMDAVSQIGKQIPISCPDCGGALWEIKESDIPRFRCHIGHVFNEEGLLRSQSQAMEETFWVTLRMLEERLHMLIGMHEREKKAGKSLVTSSIEERIEEVKIHIERIREILGSNEIYKSQS
jgi:two-component system chemotaxis response regulator CheB